MPDLPATRADAPRPDAEPRYTLNVTPRDGLASLALVAGLRELGPVARTVADMVTELTGLAPISLSVLQAVDGGHLTYEQAGREAGLDTATATACLGGLLDDGLLEPLSGADEPRLRLTDAGHVRVGQAEALQVRLADAVLATVGVELGQSLAVVVAAVARRLTDAAGAQRLTSAVEIRS